MIFLVDPDPEPNPGPLWCPTVWDGKYPAQGGDKGDIYINRYRDPPLYYIFYDRDNSQPIKREEIAEWVTGGLMMVPRMEDHQNSSLSSNSSRTLAPKSPGPFLVQEHEL